MSYLHVKQIISSKSFSKNLPEGCGFPKDPKWNTFHDDGNKGSIPDWVIKRKCHSQYGMLMDVLVRQMLCDLCRSHGTTMVGTVTKHKGWSTDLFKISQQVFSGYGSKSKLPAESTLRATMELDLVYEWLEKLFLSKSKPHAVALAPEFNHGQITSHPDLIFDGMVLDIKTTGDFSKMKRDALLQVLCYYSLLKTMGPTNQLGLAPRGVGFLLPVTRELLWLELPTEFDHSKFWTGMNVPLVSHNEIIWRRQLNEVSLSLIRDGRQTIFRTIGNTVRKEKGSISGTIASYLDHLKVYGERWAQPACQLYIHPPLSKRLIKIYESDLDKTRSIIAENKLLFYTHTPYVINLCDLEVTSRGEEDVATKALGVVRKDLEVTAKIGGKGVVIHTGKSKKMGVRSAALKMRSNMIKLLRSATPETQLLLETGAGQGTELLCSARGMALFYKAIPEELRERFGICVDTCHVFSAGYDPYQYILDLEKLAPGALKMIHYNNSSVPKGSCHDSHAGLFEGYIEIKCLYEVAVWARKNNVPLIRE